MVRSRRNLESLTSANLKAGAASLNHRNPLQNIEELPCSRMKMAALAITRWHTFLNHTQLRAIEQMPAFAVFAPLIALARIYIDYMHFESSQLFGPVQAMEQPMQEWRHQKGRSQKKYDPGI